MTGYTIPSEYFPPRNLPADVDGTNIDDPIESMMRDKLDTLRITLIDITIEMSGRRKFEVDLIDIIDGDICVLKSKLHEIESWGPGTNSIIDSRRSGLEKQIIDLGKEKRSRRTERYRDTALLKKEFRQLFIEYKNELRRSKIIGK